MWIREYDDREPKLAVGTQVISLAALACMSFEQAGTAMLHAADAWRELGLIENAEIVS